MTSFKLFLVFLVVLTFALLVVMYEQNSYTIKTERAEVTSYNAKLAVAKVKFFKYNRTYTALNFSLDLKRDVGTSLVVDVEGFKFQSNEYRQFPIIFSTNLCETIEKNDFGVQNVFDCGNFSRCPFKKGVYHFCNWGPDYAKFPPHVPSGQYRMDLKAMFFSEEMIYVRWYIKIESVGLF